MDSIEADLLRELAEIEVEGRGFYMKGLNMPTIKIDDKDYDIDQLSKEAKQQLEMLAATDAKLRELQHDLAITQTARNAYARALGELLPK